MTALEMKEYLEATYPGYNAAVIDSAYAGWSKPCLTIYMMKKPDTDIEKSVVYACAYTDPKEALVEIREKIA